MTNRTSPGPWSTHRTTGWNTSILDAEGKSVALVKHRTNGPDNHLVLAAAPEAVELLRTVEDEWGELFDSDEPMNGGDCCEWLCNFIEAVRPILAHLNGKEIT